MRFGQRVAATATLALGIGLAAAAPSFAVHQTVTGLVSGANSLVQFPVGTPGTLLSGPVAVGGVAGDLVGIDYRPRTNTLYGVNDAGQVYLITPTLPVGATASDGTTTAWTATAIGTSGVNPADVASGVDFNPVPDAIRLNNEADENLRLNPNTGGLAGTDTGLAFAVGDVNDGDNPAVGAAGYTNSFDGAATTTLYDIEAGNDVLAIQNPPNAGTLNTVGALTGAGDVTAIAGLDIEPFTNNTPYAALQTMGDASSKFYRLNATTGAATALGTGAPFIGATSPGAQLVESVSLVPTSTASFVNAVTSVSESGSTATVTVTRVGPLNQQATMNYATSVSGVATMTNPVDTASASDFTAASGTLTFAPGDASESFTVPIAGDTADEGDETFTVSLTGPSRSVNFPSAPPLTAKVNIVDDDDAPAGKPGQAPIGLISVPSQKIDSSIAATYACDEACGASLELKLGGKSLDTRSSSLAAAGSQSVTFALSKSEVKQAKKKAKGKKVAKLSVSGSFSDADGSSSSTVKFQLG